MDRRRRLRKKMSFAWLQPLMEKEQAIIGRDWPKRPTIEALLQYLYEQGLASRRVALEELFTPSTMRDIPLSEGQLV